MLPPPPAQTAAPVTAAAAALIIQRSYRGHRIRRTLVAQHAAATKIQTHARAYLARVAFRKQRVLTAHRQSVDAAAHRTRSRIEARERMLGVLRSVPDVDAWEARRRERAARALQRWWRGERVRRKYRHRPRTAAAAAAATITAAEITDDFDAPPPPPPATAADRQPIYDIILAHLSYRRREPLPESYRPPQNISLSWSLNSTAKAIPPLITEIDSYISYITSTSADMLGGMALAERVAPVKIKSVNGVDVRQEHLRALRRAKGSQEDQTEGPLPPFFPRPATSPLPDLTGKSPQELQLPYDPRGRYHGARLLRSIDVDLRARLDLDKRAELFAPGSPTAVEPGSILLIEQVTSRSRPRKQVFAGVLIAIRRKGVMSNIVVRNYVLGTGVEMVFPIYSPSVARIKVLKRVTGVVRGDNMYYLRDKPSASPLSFTKIDEMVVRDREQERRTKKMQSR
ncbi:hypothetical protein HDU88_004390 [Geranomyces variabilis]|nr:hypothetical protein HDU88_004390 [Geranomyces variabilis]